MISTSTEESLVAEIQSIRAELASTVQAHQHFSSPQQGIEYVSSGSLEDRIEQVPYMAMSGRYMTTMSPEQVKVYKEDSHVKVSALKNLDANTLQITGSMSGYRLIREERDENSGLITPTVDAVYPSTSVADQEATNLRRRYGDLLPNLHEIRRLKKPESPKSPRYAGIAALAFATNAFSPLHKNSEKQGLALKFPTEAFKSIASDTRARPHSVRSKSPNTARSNSGEESSGSNGSPTKESDHIGKAFNVRRWKEKEDVLLMEIIHNLGNADGDKRNWHTIASQVPDRSAKQCRERWHSQLDPSINRLPWTAGEEDVLIKHHKTMGNKWTEIAKLMPGRTDNSVKNQWKSIKRRINSNSETSSTKRRRLLQGSNGKYLTSVVNRTLDGRSRNLEPEIDLETDSMPPPVAGRGRSTSNESASSLYSNSSINTSRYSSPVEQIDLTEAALALRSFSR